MRDRVYSEEQPHIVDFAFSAEVTAVFPDMIRRSVPGYETIIPMTGLIAARQLGLQGKGVDLGCSLGATTQAILAQNPTPAVRVIGIDNSSPMIEGAVDANLDNRATFVLMDILDADTDAYLVDADVIVLNFVLQFCEPSARAALLKRIRSLMAPDGLVILSEKVRDADPGTHSFYDETHLAWKRANGYSELEVSQKRTALENVMIVDTEAEHRSRLAEAGFHGVTQWYKCLNWASFIARPQPQ